MPEPAEAADSRSSLTAAGRTRLLPAAAWLAGVWRREHVRAALLIAAGVFLYLSPVLVGGRVLSPATAMYDWTPWKASATPDLAAYHNAVLSDVPRLFQPWAAFARTSLHHGHLPTWSPYALAGTPFVGNAQTVLFSPFSLPIWLLSLNFGLGLSAALKLWVAGFGTYLLIRRLGPGFWPAVLGALVFAFGSFNVVWLNFPLTGASVMLPWALWLAERIIDRGRPADAVGLAAVIGVAQLGGHPETGLHLLLILALYSACRLALAAARGREAITRIGLLAGACALGIGLAAVALLPVVDSVHDSFGLAVRHGGSGPQPAAGLRTVLFPDWWGRPSGVFFGDAIGGGPAASVYNGRTVYSGVVALVLAAIALLSWDDWRRKLPFALMGGLSLAVVFGVGPFLALLDALPPFDRTLNDRLSLAVNLAVAVLAAMGLQQLLDDRRVRRRAAAAGALAVALCLVALVSIGPTLHELRTTIHHFRFGTDFPSPHVIELTSVLWALGLSAALLVVVALRRRLGRAVTLAAVGALVVVDVAHFAYGYQPMPPPSRVYSFTPNAIRYLQSHQRDERITALGPAVIPPDTGMFYGLRDIRGYDPPAPSVRYMRVFRLANPAQPDWALTIPALTSGAKRVMDLLSARYIAQDPAEPPIKRGDLQVVYRGADGLVYRNAGAAPRAYIPEAALAIADDSRALRVLAGPRFAPGHEAVVATRRAVPATPGGHARVVSETDSRVTLRVRLPQHGLVVLNDAWAKGWHVTVDGHATRALRVNTVVRGAIVPPGSHTVTWTYDAPGLFAGAILSGVSLLVLAACGLVIRARRRRAAS